MVASASEEPRRLSSKVPNLLLSSVKQAVDVFGFCLILICLCFLLHRSWESLLFRAFFFKVVVHLCEVAFVEIGDERTIEGLTIDRETGISKRQPRIQGKTNEQDDGQAHS